MRALDIETGEDKKKSRGPQKTPTRKRLSKAASTSSSTTVAEDPTCLNLISAPQAFTVQRTTQKTKTSIHCSSIGDNLKLGEADKIDKTPKDGTRDPETFGNDPGLNEEWTKKYGHPSRGQFRL